MADSKIPVKCPRCGHKWEEDVEELKKQKAEIYKSKDPATGAQVTIANYRVQCPNCGQRTVVSVKETPDAPV